MELVKVENSLIKWENLLHQNDVGAKGLAWTKIDENGEVTGGIAKFITPEIKQALQEKYGAENNSAMFFVADEF